MKKLFFAYAVTLLLMSSCSLWDEVSPRNSFKIDQPVTIGFGQTAVLEPDQLKITFTRVLEDSRCPTEVVCVWAGRAVVEFTFKKDNTTVTDSLARPSSAPNSSDSTTVFGRKIKLLEVTPYPKTPASIPNRDYKVKFVVN